MSGNGAYIPGRTSLQLGIYINNTLNTLSIPTGLGGGCVTSGPFANYVVNLAGNAPAPEGMLYNPRCLKRDVGPGVSQRFTKASDVLSLILNNTKIYDFQMTMEGIPGSGSIGVHGGGHFTVAGDPGGDLFGSPGDPAFYLHHGMIDRVWTAWQDLDPEARQYALSGTGTFLNNPPSADTTLDTIVDIGFAAQGDETGGRKMSDLMSTTGGEFCYVYA